MKKVLNVVLSSALVFGIIVPTSVGAKEISQEQKQFKKEKKGGSIYSNINGVEVELVGTDEESAFLNEEFVDETLSLIKEHLEKEKEKKTKGDITIFQDEIGGSGGRLAGIYPNDFEHNVWSWIEPNIKAAVNAAVTIGASIKLGTDVKTQAATSAFAGAVADTVASTLAPEYTDTFYLYDYSSYYGRTIYKQVTYIYKESSRITLQSIKVSTPLDKVVSSDGTFFRAI